MRIFIDKEFKCHLEHTEGLQEADVPAFDGKCKPFIEGMRFVPAGEHYTLDGNNTWGEAVFPWKPMDELEKAQSAFEHDLLADVMAQRDALLDEMQALIDEILGGDSNV